METSAPTTTTTPATATDLLGTAKMIGRQALTGIKAVIDSTFNRTEAAIPTLTGDAKVYFKAPLKRNPYSQPFGDRVAP